MIHFFLNLDNFYNNSNIYKLFVSKYKKLYKLLLFMCSICSFLQQDIEM
jgi:hypothetical protein